MQPDEASRSAENPLVAGIAAEPGSAKTDPILVIDNVSRAFGGLVAVDVDHLEIQRGTITCLLYTSPSPRDATLSRMPSSA